MRDLARLEASRGKTEDAIAHMRAALDLNPLRPSDWFFLGTLTRDAQR